jgi:hypothetical protein
MIYEVSQAFNNSSKKNFFKLDTVASTLQGIIALMPDGQTVYSPSATGAVGTKVPVPTYYKKAKVSCFDSADGAFNGNMIYVEYGKPTLTDDDIRTACLAKVEVPNGSACDDVRVKSLRTVGTAPAV